MSGEGQWVESSLLAAQIAMLDFQAARWLVGREVPEQAGNDHPTSIPTGVFCTRDGYINIASAGDEIFRRLMIKCRVRDSDIAGSALERLREGLRLERLRLEAQQKRHQVAKQRDELLNVGGLRLAGRRRRSVEI